MLGGVWNVPMRKNYMAWGKTETLWVATSQNPPTRHRSLPNIRATQVQRSLRVKYSDSIQVTRSLGSTLVWTSGTELPFASLVVATSHFPTSTCLPP